MTEHKNIHTALVAAQQEFGQVTKGSTNPAFKSKYADLADVANVVIPTLSKHGVAVMHYMTGENLGVMRTEFVHAISQSKVYCDIPLIVEKSNMQGMKSATTYAKRIGLESLSGIAPEDDDGNAAVASAPKGGAQTQSISSDQYLELRALTEKAGVPEETVCKAAGVETLEMLPAPQFEAVKKRLNLTIQNKEQSND